MLQFRVAVLVEGLGIAVGEAQRIEESDGEGNTNQVSGGLGLVGGVESSSPAQKSEKNISIIRKILPVSVPNMPQFI